jgi:hypothetical protein
MVCAVEKRDYKKELKHLYLPSAREVVAVDVPAMNFIMIDGTGDPNTSAEFQDAVEALYGMSYTAKFVVKKKGEVDFVVPPLEGLWWADDIIDFTASRRDNWKWTAMIMQPPYVDEELFERSREDLKKKKDPPALSKARFETFEEGLSAQIMYIGPFAEEGPTIKRLHAYISEGGHALRGKHHEIYLSDFRRTAPEKLKTVIRQPME